MVGERADETGTPGAPHDPYPAPHTPATVAAVGDPGDDIQRNFRYQHAFGVILLVAAASDKLPYVALYCEHHEDLLPERVDGRYDAYQIKTRTPEAGAWQLNDEEFEKTIRRFVLLDARFPAQIAEFYFVSNTACLETVPTDRPHRSPVKLLDAIRAASNASELTGRTAEAFATLRVACDQPDTKCTDVALWAVVRRLKLVPAPGRDEIFGVVAHEHLPKLDACAHLPPARLNGLRDELIDLVMRAASRGREDPSRHYLPLGPRRDEARINAKRVTIDELMRVVAAGTLPSLPPFRYTVAPERLAGTPASQTQPVLEQKLVHAGLHQQVDLMHRRALDAERILLERHASGLGALDASTLDHVTSVVSAECTEALLAAQVQTAAAVGLSMLNDVYTRLQRIAGTHPSGVARLPYEVLVGIAALLTGECKVWWGARFDLAASKAVT